MTENALTTSYDALVRDLTAALGDAGYVYLPLTESYPKFLIRALNGLTGGTNSHLRTTYADAIAAIASNLSGTSISARTTALVQLMITVIENSGGGGPASGDLVELENASGTIELEDASGSILLES